MGLLSFRDFLWSQAGSVGCGGYYALRAPKPGKHMALPHQWTCGGLRVKLPFLRMPCPLEGGHDFALFNSLFHT